MTLGLLRDKDDTDDLGSTFKFGHLRCGVASLSYWIKRPFR
uniref:Uncharacterized protein n=1 Tax=Rhizophora mucronata TaxID=61149 RepID=A0A2P2PTJ1_RHIMU